MVYGKFRQQLWRETEADQATAGLRRDFPEKARQQPSNRKSICLSREQRRNFQPKKYRSERVEGTWGPEPSWTRASRK